MIQEILEYKNILQGVEGILNRSPLKKSYIIEQIGIPAPTFYRKLKSLTFTPDEMLKIATIVNPKEALLLELQNAEKDYKEGRVKDHKEVMTYLRNKYLR